MFLTTIRVRRARRTTLDAHITNTTRLQALRALNVLEVLAHGKPVAIVTVTDLGTIGQWEWTHPDLGQREVLLEPLVLAAVPLMQAVKAAGLCDQPELPEASPRARAPRPGRSRERKAA